MAGSARGDGEEGANQSDAPNPPTPLIRGAFLAPAPEKGRAGEGFAEAAHHFESHPGLPRGWTPGPDRFRFRGFGTCGGKRVGLVPRIDNNSSAVAHDT